mmetsp:Transcript_149354/g.212357  ORF Transcript_149354/g.212357 Transcript_149354/m.212357 type:complete len:207 (+) Transcript_149354:155-775(+)
MPRKQLQQGLRMPPPTVCTAPVNSVPSQEFGTSPLQHRCSSELRPADWSGHRARNAQLLPVVLGLPRKSCLHNSSMHRFGRVCAFLSSSHPPPSHRQGCHFPLDAVALPQAWSLRSDLHTRGPTDHSIRWHKPMLASALALPREAVSAPRGHLAWLSVLLPGDPTPDLACLIVAEPRPNASGPSVPSHPWRVRHLPTQWPPCTNCA